MQTITVEELIDYKILPFDIFTEDEKLLYSAGEVMTPGKFLKLRNVEHIYKKEDTMPEIYDEQVKPDIWQETQEEDSEVLLNRFSVFSKNEQIILQKADNDSVVQIIADNAAKIANEKYASRLRLLGDYDVCHNLNTAIFACALSLRLGKNMDFVEHIVNSVLKEDSITFDEQKIVEICSYFDDLLFGKTEFEIKTAKDALKKMLEIGTKRFQSAIFYTFVYMFNYNDTKLFHEMLI